MNNKLLRIAYALEFLIAIDVVFNFWSQVGGQNHLDLMAWYWKLILSLGCAYAIVRATAAAVEEDRTWNRQTLRWLSILLAFAVVAGMVTLYYHIYEPSDEEDQNAPAEYGSEIFRPPSPIAELPAQLRAGAPECRSSASPSYHS